MRPSLNPTDEKWLYLTTVMDLCSRKIVGRSTADHLRSELAGAALEKALRSRRIERGLAERRSVKRGCPFGDGAWQKATAKELGLEWMMRPRSRPARKPVEEVI